MFILLFQITLLCTLHTSTATVDLNKLTEKVATKLQTVKEKASTTFQDFVDTIDFDKVKHYDVLHILPKIETKIQFGKTLIEQKQKAIQQIPMLFAPSQKETLKWYGQQVRSLKGQDFLDVIELPFPLWRRMDYIE